MKEVLATHSKIFPTRHEVFRQWVHSFLRATFCTLRGAFAHLRTTPSRFRACDVAVATSEMSAPNFFVISEANYVTRQSKLELVKVCILLSGPIQVNYTFHILK